MAQPNSNNYYSVPEEWDGKRLDQFLAKSDATHSRSYFQRLIEEAGVTINKTLANKPGQLLRAGENITITKNLDLGTPQAEAQPLDILYEDEDILVINKPSDLTVHPTERRNTGTLVNSLLYHSITIAEAVYDVHSMVSAMRPGIVHRLDKDTSGVLVVAKNRESLLHLAKQFQDHSVEKEYLALVHGELREAETITAPIRRKPSTKNMMGVSLKEGEGRNAITHITPKEHYTSSNHQSITLIRCTIETGRTHQIRVHCKYIGHPIIGDPIYTNRPARALSEHMGAPRQLLHASRLSLTHPKTSKRMHFTAPLPSDMETILTKLQRT